MGRAIMTFLPAYLTRRSWNQLATFAPVFFGIGFHVECRGLHLEVHTLYLMCRDPWPRENIDCVDVMRSTDTGNDEDVRMWNRIVNYMLTQYDVVLVIGDKLNLCRQQYLFPETY